jgi:hypothetical protein
LTCDVGFEALRDIPVAFAPYGSGEWSLHGFIVSQAREVFHRLVAAFLRALRSHTEQFPPAVSRNETPLPREVGIRYPH